MITELKLKLILKGVAQRRVAELAGVSETYVSRCVRGLQKPSAKITRALAQLGIKEGGHD